MFEQSLKHHQQLDNKASISDAYSNIGMTHMENGDPEKGLPYMLESLQVIVRTGKKSCLGRSNICANM